MEDGMEKKSNDKPEAVSQFGKIGRRSLLLGAGALADAAAVGVLTVEQVVVVVVELVAAKRVAADQFGEAIRLVHGRAALRTHFVQGDRQAG